MREQKPSYKTEMLLDDTNTGLGMNFKKNFTDAANTFVTSVDAGYSSQKIQFSESDV